MRISDWSSDVCSSDLHPARLDALGSPLAQLVGDAGENPAGDRNNAAGFFGQRNEFHRRDGAAFRVEIGRASCRERVCQYVSISVVADSLKQKKSQLHSKAQPIVHTSTTQNSNP